MKNIGYLLSYAWGKCKPLFVTTSLKHLLAGVIPLVGIVGIGSVVDALIAGATQEEVFYTIVVYLSVNLLITLLSTAVTLVDNIVMRRASDITQTDYMTDCVFINYHYVEDKSILDLKRKSMGANPVWFLDSVFKILFYLVQFTGVAHLFVILSPWFLLVIATTSALSIFLNFYKKRIDFDCHTTQVEDDGQLDYLYRTMSSYQYAKEIRINQASDFLSEKYKTVMDRTICRLRRLSLQRLGIDGVIAAVTTLQTVVMYAFFSWQVSVGAINIAKYVVLLGATTLLVSILLGFFSCIGDIRKTASYADLFRAYRTTVRKNSNIELGRYPVSCPIDWERPEIQFSHVTFSYPDHKDAILQDVSFTIHPGEHIGIVGLNGSGKTTLIKLLLRLYDPTEGIITINGVDIKTIPHGEYVRRFGVVLQDYCIFAYSVKENIIFDTLYDERRCHTAIEMCGLADKVNRLPFGIDTPLYKELDDDGVEFSGGEGQKLSLARAMYKNADVMVLDEYTSALDPIAENVFFQNLSMLSGGKTSLFISHRLSATVFCDRIFVISGGKIVESGTHEDLMKHRGLYADLFQLQAKYYDCKEVTT